MRNDGRGFGLDANESGRVFLARSRDHAADRAYVMVQRAHLADSLEQVRGRIAASGTLQGLIRRRREGRAGGAHHDNTE